MTQEIKISVIVAVYNRPKELSELLDSLAQQTHLDFELIVVDDGSPVPLQNLVESYKEKIQLQYFYKENSGPGKSRNFGMQRAKGNYFVFLDSDCIAPKTHIASILQALQQDFVDGFGGPDAAAEDFNSTQKAISFAMTSFLTTGGIRGGKKQIAKFQPRSFNMGISKHAFLLTKGFSDLRIGEDPDLSMRLWQNGLQTKLLPNVKVYHKRRSTFGNFAKQVFQFGVARPILNQRHKAYVKALFWFPSLFLLGTLLAMALICLESFLFKIPMLAVLIYFLFIFLLASVQNKNLLVGVLAILASGIQLYVYGFGFLLAQIKLNVFKQNPKQAFPSHFYS